MNLHHVLLFCFTSAALRDGNSGLVAAETFILTEGGSIRVGCHFSLSGRKMFLCRDGCKEDDVLIEAKDDRAQRGRYSILYQRGANLLPSSVVYVSITQLTKSDSGRYRCGLERPYLPDSYCEFDIRITDESLPEKATQPEQQLTEETSAAASLHRVEADLAGVEGEDANVTDVETTAERGTTFQPTKSGYKPPLLVCVTLFVLFVVVVFLLCRRTTGLSTRGQPEDRNMEFTIYENSSK